jgi:Metallo-beta-lactamase superfamily
VVVHVGDGDWIVVDSCIDRQSGNSIALEYLNSIGVDLKSQIKLVVATHWHDDHIQGMATLLEAAASAKFVDSAAYSFKHLLRVVELGAKLTAGSSATREFDAITTVLQSRRLNGQGRDAVGPLHALANKKLLALLDHSRSIQCEVFALSPADDVFSRAENELHYALSEIKKLRRPAPQGPNQLSVVLWCKVGVLDLLLGADLEHVSGTTEGWLAIVSSQERPGGRAGFFKVPHHGSENADCPSCWTELLSEKPIAVLTPYASSGLPRKLDIIRLCDRTPEVYLTSDPTKFGLPRRDNAVDKTLREVVISRRARSGRMGHVRMRCYADTVGAESQIEFRNGAKRVCVS